MSRPFESWRSRPADFNGDDGASTLERESWGMWGPDQTRFGRINSCLNGGKRNLGSWAVAQFLFGAYVDDSSLGIGPLHTVATDGMALRRQHSSRISQSCCFFPVQLQGTGQSSP